MGTWLASVNFPDGSTKYTDYYTVSGTVTPHGFRSELVDRLEYPAGKMLGGEIDPHFPDQAWSTIDELMTVVVELDRDNISWPALYCPHRREILGPLSDGVPRLHKFAFIRDNKGLKHLVKGEDVNVYGPAMEAQHRGNTISAVCGSEVAGEHSHIDVNPYSLWNSSTICRYCLLHRSAIERDE
jgi:hypothetical protein